MAENSKIAWTNHTFNHIRGCQKVAAGCVNCYADSQSRRNPSVLGVWGPQGTRVIASEDMWKKPLKWNRLGAANGEQPKTHICRKCKTRYFCESGASPECDWKCDIVPYRPRVFCASFADVFEDWNGPILNSVGSQMFTCPVCGYIATVNQIPGEFWEQGVDDQDREIFWCPDHPMTDGGQVVVTPTTMNDVRARLFRLIDSTPNLDWLLLTKRPENIRKMWFSECPDCHGNKMTCGHFPAMACGRSNVWLGTSVAEQADADRNILLLLKCRDLAPVLFVSAEPLIGPVDFTLSGADIADWDEDWKYNVLSGHEFSSPRDDSEPKSDKIDWVIVGGESGHHARACNVSWIRSIVDQCHAAGTPCFVKQLGANAIGVVQRGEYVDGAAVPMVSRETRIKLNDPKGGDISEWPGEHLKIRQFPKGSVDRVGV